MPSNIVVPTGTRRELASEVAETVPPWEKKYFQKINKFFWFNIRFRPTSFFPEILVITALTTMAGRKERPRE